MTNLELAKEQGNQSAPNVIDAAKASEVQIDITLAQEQGNQAAPLIADSLANSELYDAIKQQGNQAMPLIVDALVQPTPSTESPMYLEAAQANSTVSMVSTLETAPNLEYSIDGETWQEWEYTDQTLEGMTVHTFDIITLGAVGDKVYFRGNNPNGLAFLPEGVQQPNFSNFVLTRAINAGGNVMSLLDKTMELTEVPAHGFMGLFTIMGEGIEPALLTPPLMDTITTIADRGCANMYYGCTSLTSAADMPALTSIGEGGCAGMYYGCTSLTSAAGMPALTSIGDYGCEGMYSGCTSLTSAADMPALTSIGEGGCDGMYSGCTSLTAAADMPALTSIADHGCSGMYSNCTFNMSDDGNTLNFAFPTPPVTAGEETFETAEDVAAWMGNTTGFITSEQ